MVGSRQCVGLALCALAGLFSCYSAAQEKLGLNTPVSHKRLPTFGPPGCQVCVVGADVIELKDLKTSATLEGDYESRGLRALSPTGKYFTAVNKTPNITETTVFVWATATGKKVLQIPPRAGQYVDVLEITDKHVLVGGRHNNKIEVWDIEAGKPLRQLTVPDRRVEKDKIAFAPDGSYFACIAHDRVITTNANTGKRAATMAQPLTYLPNGGTRLSTGPESIFVFAWTNAIRYSPDGEFVAAYSTNPLPRLMCWDKKGKLVLDSPVPMPHVVSHRTNLQWLPESKGWLINGYVFERESRRLLLSVRTPFATEVMPQLMDRDRVAGTFGEDPETLRSVVVPWDKLQDAVKKLNEKTPAFIAPYQSVSLDVSVGGARGDSDETQQFLTLALTQRLARDGVKVATGQSTTLRFRVSEAAGETLAIYERQSAFDRRGRDTGRTATESNGAAVLELVSAEEKSPLWRASITASSARSFTEEINDATLRKSMLEHLVRQLHGMDMPYFIPKSKDIVALPAVIE
jgi:hypothetical protein